MKNSIDCCTLNMSNNKIILNSILETFYEMS